MIHRPKIIEQYQGKLAPNDDTKATYTIIVRRSHSGTNFIEAEQTASSKAGVTQRCMVF
jgi:hypothetical protein